MLREGNKKSIADPYKPETSKGKEWRDVAPDMRVDPENHIRTKYDSTSITRQTIADHEIMGMRVMDDCAEDNMK